MPEGGAAINADNETFLAKPNNVILIPPYTPIRHILTNPGPHLWCHFALGQPFDSLKGKVFSTSLTPAMKCLSEELRNTDQSETFYRFLLSSWVTQAAAQISPTDWPSSAKDLRIREILHHINFDPSSQDLNNAQLAKRIAMSRNAFLRLFSQQMGIPPGAYVLQRRLDKAGLLLQTSTKSIDEITEDCGFASRSYFSRVFKKKVGFSPGEYRKLGGNT